MRVGASEDEGKHVGDDVCWQIGKEGLAVRLILAKIAPSEIVSAPTCGDRANIGQACQPARRT